MLAWAPNYILQDLQITVAPSGGMRNRHPVCRSQGCCWSFNNTLGCPPKTPKFCSLQMSVMLRLRNPILSQHLFRVLVTTPFANEILIYHEWLNSENIHAWSHEFYNSIKSRKNIFLVAKKEFAEHIYLSIFMFSTSINHKEKVCFPSGIPI